MFFGTPQRSVKINIWVNFYFNTASEMIGAGKVKIMINFERYYEQYFDNAFIPSLLFSVIRTSPCQNDIKCTPKRLPKSVQRH